MQPARSYSPLRYIPGICAVSPPISAQPAARQALREAANELVEHARLQFFAADVIEKKKRPRAEHRDVVHAMIHEIGADGVVFVQRESDFQFRPDAVDARDQHRLAHSEKFGAEQSAEAADFPEHLRAVRLPDERLDPALQPVAKIDIDAGARVGFFHLVRTRARRVLIISDPRTSVGCAFLLGQRFGAGFAFFHDELVQLRIDRQRIIAGETGEAKFVHRPAGRAHHSFDIEITEAVDAEIFADFLHRHLVRDQLFRIGKIDAVMAGEPVRRTAHAHVHFLRAGFAQIDDAGARGRSAHDRIVDHHDAFSFHHFLDQIQFHPHVEIANQLARLEERAADVVIADKGVLVGNFSSCAKPSAA